MKPRIKIILRGNPISTQHLYKIGRNRLYMTKEGRYLKEDYQHQAKSQYKGEPLDCRVWVHIHLFFKDRRRRDWDNWHKISMDALSGIVWRDDCLIQEAKVIKNIDKDNPRIEILVGRHK